MYYTESALVPVMQHMAKNVVMVNRGLTKHMVSKYQLLSICLLQLPAAKNINGAWIMSRCAAAVPVGGQMCCMLSYSV